MPDSHLEIIEYTNAVKWEEEGKEFRIKDEFYDVICIKKQNGKIFLYCLNDKNEEDLVRNFDKTIKSAADNEKGKNDKHSFKFPLPDQLIIYFVSSGPLGNTVLHHYFNYTTTLVSNCREIIIPPPRGLA